MSLDARRPAFHTEMFLIIIGIKHVFPCINIRWVPREVLKTEGAARGFQHRPRNPANVKGDRNPNDKYVLSERALLTMNFDTSVIKIS